MRDYFKFYFLSCPASHSHPTEAYGILKDCNKKGVALGPAPYDHVIRCLLAEGSLEDAMAVKDL